MIASCDIGNNSSILFIDTNQINHTMKKIILISLIFMTFISCKNNIPEKEYNITQLQDCNYIADSLICMGFDSNDAYIIGGFETDLYDEADTTEYRRYIHLCDSLKH